MVKIIRKLIKFYFIIFIIILVLTNIFMFILNKKTMPILISYASNDAKNKAISVLRNTGLKKINKLIDKNDLYNELKNNNGNTQSIDFDIPSLNNALLIISKEVRNKLKEEEKSKIYKIPIGVASNNAFFKSVGPKVPVKVEYKGNVGLDLKSRVKPYGIDSALIEIYVKVEVTQKTIIPFQSKEIKISSDIPIVMKIIKGTNTGILVDKSSSYSLPPN